MKAKFILIFFAYLSTLLFILDGRVHGQTDAPPSITDMSLEDLLNVEVTSVSKRAQSAFRSPSAIYVITQDDIRHSAASTLPDLLRGVPGLEVAQLNGSQWAITARGFNGEFNTKMLVMVDGRSVFDPFFSGVFWNLQDFVLEDIERIEIIRGPGGTLWGANAVNGVINIITKPARETQGGLVSVTGGNQERVSESTRYGGKVGEKSYYRVYSRFFDREPQAGVLGPGHDGWGSVKGGFRFETQLTDHDSLSVDGTLVRQFGEEAIALPSLQPPYSSYFPFDFSFSGGSAMTSWKRKLSHSSDLQVQFWFDQLTKTTPLMDEGRHSSDFDFQHHFALGERNDVIWGANYRFFSDATAAVPNMGLTFAVPRSTHNLYSVFAEDDIRLVPNRLSFTVGSKFEHNRFTGWEIQPNVRLTYTPTRKQTWWAAVSRAARIPSGSERFMQAIALTVPMENGVVGLVQSTASPVVTSEHILAYEFGYRVQVGQKTSVDIATFSNSYTHLASQEPQAPIPTPGYVLLPIVEQNNLYGRGWGGELSATWKPMERWRWATTYSYLGMDIHKKTWSNDVTYLQIAGTSPRHQAAVKSSFDFTKALQGDLAARFVDRLTSIPCPGYFELNSKLTWKAGLNWRFSVAGENLAHGQHLEFGNQILSLAPTAVKRSVYGKVEWHIQ